MAEKIILSSEEKLAIKADYDKGMSSTFLATKYGYSISFILKKIKEIGGKIRPPGKDQAITNAFGNNVIISDIQKEEIIVKYKLGLDLTSLSKEYNCPTRSIKHILKNEGLYSVRTHELDETVFDNVENSPEGAYIVGLLMSDGCISETNQYCKGITIQLSGEDGDHLEFVRSYLKATNKICDAQLRKTNYCENPQKAKSLYVSSLKLVKELEKYGVVPRKSLIAEVKLLENNEYFWCGMVCGDGCVYINGEGKPVISLCGSEFAMKQFAEFIRSNYPNFNGEAHKYNGPWRVECKCSSAIAITKLLFENCEFALPRKLKIAKEIIAMEGQFKTRR